MRSQLQIPFLYMIYKHHQQILYYKAKGNHPLIASGSVTVFTGKPSENASPATPSNQPNSAVTTPTATPADTSKPTEVAVAPIPPVDSPQSSNLKLDRPLSVIERRYAEAAWRYFQANYHSKSGLIDDRSDLKGATLWGLGDYLAALHAARSLDIITPKEFDQRTRHLLAALTKLPLFEQKLPGRGYDTRSLQPVDYGGNPIPEGNGWSALDLGKMLAALYNLKTCHPEYTAAVDKIVLDWSYLRVVHEGILSSATTTKEQDGRSLTRVNPETHLGYEEPPVVFNYGYKT
ncbi:Tfp pilus assembly protein FimV [Nostoc sphaeroides CCNUC1]|uniref:Tfp pilus assembly protein FimV (Plasmid) n=2 Tax=Nostoc sphaeroides TaxID=446679 RepID=A0A5P8WBT1_9NOSO|nr:Tfp pilus assembly protein FimV [Nostoc sphaeroides CCNUC1]